MADVKHLSMVELDAGLDEIRQSPLDAGELQLIVRRPDTDMREVLETGELDPDVGLVGDNWIMRGSSRTKDGSSHPDMQINIMSSRVIALIAQDKARWQLAGDQLFVDLDLSEENLPAGTQLSVGNAIVEITDQIHAGCQKFTERFGRDALLWVNSPTGKTLHLRGLNAKVVQAGTISVGDTVQKL